MPWIPAAVQAGAAIYSAIKGRKKDPAQAMAEQMMMKQLQRSDSLWPQAEAGMNQVDSYYRNLAGGSRTSGMEAIAPDVQQAGERIDEVNQAQGRLMGRSGGATTDPYAKAGLFTQMLLKARQGAVGGLMDVAKTRAGWAQNQGDAASSLFNAGQVNYKNAQERGAGLTQTLSSTLPSIWDALKNIKGGGGGVSATPSTGWFNVK
jgi:hypothetical protein